MRFKGEVRVLDLVGLLSFLVSNGILYGSGSDDGLGFIFGRVWIAVDHSWFSCEYFMMTGTCY
ncbi:hypothetical protein AMTRI_Chr04g248670 [Amborella trichopoda]